MPKGKKKKNIDEAMILKTDPKATDKYQCTCCGKKYSNLEVNFYASKSVLHKNNGRLTVCKQCVKEIYDSYYRRFGFLKKAVYETCKILDYPFNLGTYEGADKESHKNDKKNLMATYIVKINSLGGTNNTGNCFLDSDEIDNEYKIMETGSLVKEKKEDMSEFTLTRDMIWFWGGGLEREDYMFLENEYNDWCARYEVDSKSMEMLVKQICLQTLDINRRRAKGEKVDQQLKTLQDLLASSNIKPVQEMAMGDKTISTWGEWIKKIEETEPIPEPTDEFRDPDGIKKYIDMWFVKHFSKVFGLFTENDDLEINNETSVVVDKEGENNGVV